MTGISPLLKWTGIAGTSITLLNGLGVAVFLLLKGAWHLDDFSRLLLLALMFEGLVMALVGCLSFFGLEKYRVWLRGDEDYNGRPNHPGKLTEDEKTRPDMRLLLLTLGILLFLTSFAGFSLRF